MPARLSGGARVGEGVEIQVVSRSKPEGPDGVVTLGLDFSRAAVPDRRYVADSAQAILEPERARLLFGQSKITGGGLRSLLDIQMSAHDVGRVLPTFDRLDATRRQRGLAAQALTEITDEPAQTVGLTATTMAISYANMSGCIDFYYVSPFVLGAIGKGGPLLADPVVRVSLPQSLMFGIIEKLASGFKRIDDMEVQT